MTTKSDATGAFNTVRLKGGRTRVPEQRIRSVNTAGVRGDRQIVLYWMIAQRRTEWNYGLQRAVEWSIELRRPLVILEAVRVGYRWASDRFHRFILQGMFDNCRRISQKSVLYYPYVEPESGAGSGLLEAWAAQAAVVVTDEFPCFFLPRMVEATADRLDVRIEAVDSNGIVPLRASSMAYPTAYAFRRFLQAKLPQYLQERPEADPLATRGLPERFTPPDEIEARWPRAEETQLSASLSALSKLPIDHRVAPAALEGGTQAARRTWQRFLKERLECYVDDRNQPEKNGSSGLSSYLHFGHLSVHEIWHELARFEEWTSARLAGSTKGRREGWWGMSAPAEAFLDQLITWRELGYNFCFHRSDYDRYESLPDWALKTLEDHAADRREHVYTHEEFAAGLTHDRLWNAAQRQLVQEGRLHNYLRMLWGKKILEWSETPEDALTTMVDLNNRFAMDGRNPNSYSGILWTLGRYDRPWGPERPIFGKVRYMSSENTARKVRVRAYMDTYAPEKSAGKLF